MKELADIEAWRKARKLAGQVYRTTNTGLFRRDFGLKDQVRRAAVSVIPSPSATRFNCKIDPGVMVLLWAYIAVVASLWPCS